MSGSTAVIGTGSIGSRHIRVINGVKGAEAIAVSKRQNQVESMLDQAKTKTAVVASNTDQHVQDSLVCLKKGINLLVEKPLAVNFDSSKKILTEAKKQNKKVFVGCVLRFSESLQKFKALLPQLGAVHGVRIECGSYLPDWRPDRPYKDSYSANLEQGGVMRDLIHEIDYAGWLFGWPKALQARLINTGQLGIASEEIADLNWMTDKGALVSIYLDYLSKPARRTMTATGQQGTLQWDGIKNQTVFKNEKGETEVFQSKQQRDQRFEAQYKAFLEAVSGKTSEVLATGEEGLKALAVCDAARESSRSKKEEKVIYK